jgi:hypothetical protein
MNWYKRFTSLALSVIFWLAAPLVMFETENALAQSVTTVRVDIAAGSATPPNNGDDWGSDAFKYLQDALTYAASNATTLNHVHVWVANGTYRPDEDASNPTGDDDESRSFELRDYVKIYGGFKGDETALAERRVRLYRTFLDGDLLANDSRDSEAPGPYATGRSDNSRHVVTAFIVNDEARLDGFIITGGEAASDLTGAGAQLSCFDGIIANCTFYANQALHAAAVYIGDGLLCATEPRIARRHQQLAPVLGRPSSDPLRHDAPIAR